MFKDAFEMVESDEKKHGATDISNMNTDQALEKIITRILEK